ncbi:hypothetical protein QE152_g35725 [Popillia japonica]|uniref:MADF domain-containing protein n=1 Tax=Popillia japonica TaxID=7064 RepID=A0AAW1IFG7_POPJA
MELPEDIVKKKIASIRATYLLEKKKIADSCGTGTGADDLHVSTLPWFGEMEFLNDVIISRKTTSNLNYQTITQDENDEGESCRQQHSAEITGIAQSENDNNVVELPAVQPKRTSTRPTLLYNKHATSGQSQKKRKSADTLNDTSSIDAALNKLCNMTNADMFDNFGKLNSFAVEKYSHE